MDEEIPATLSNTTTYNILLRLFIYLCQSFAIRLCVRVSNSVTLFRFVRCYRNYLAAPRNVHAQRDYSITCVFVENHNKSLENEPFFYLNIFPTRSI